MDLTKTIRILLVEDSPTDAFLTQEALGGFSGFAISHVERLDDALATLADENTDVVLLDLGLPDSHGLQTLRKLRQSSPDVPVIVLTAKDDEELALQAAQNGAQEYLVKNQLQQGNLRRAIRYVVERHRIEEGLRQSEEQFRLLVEGVRDYAIMNLDPQGVIVGWNLGAERITGYRAEEVIGAAYTDIFADEPGARETVEQRLHLEPNQGSVHRECWRTRKGGAKFWADSVVTATLDSKGKLRGYSIILRDMTERRRAEQELLLRDRAIQAVSQGIVITDPNRWDHPIIYVSPGFERLTGYRASEVLGRNCRFLQGPQTDRQAVDELRQAIAAGVEVSTELLNYKKDGTPFWNSLYLTPVRDEGQRLTHFVGIQMDVTERKLLEERLRQSQKMEAVGQLAGGVAHDFNNMLSVILGYCEVLSDYGSWNDRDQNLVHEIRAAGERAAKITQQLLAFSRTQISEPKVIDLNDVVVETEKMLRPLIGEDVELVSRLQGALGSIYADPGQLQQAILNLAINARDAMPHGGTLTFETSQVEVTSPQPVCEGTLAAGSYAKLAVSDTGCGMSEHVKSHLFEPFFTTKQPGKGTGLGLSSVYGIVKQCHGHIAFDTQLGNGTTFYIYFPTVAANRLPSLSDKSPSGSMRGEETLLLIEDEEMVCTLIDDFLKSQGYNWSFANFEVNSSLVRASEPKSL